MGEKKKRPKYVPSKILKSDITNIPSQDKVDIAVL